MRSKRIFSPLTLLCILLVCVTVTGVFASWEYTGGPPDPVDSNMGVALNEFKYGLLYVTRAAVSSGTYESAQISQTADLDIRAELQLSSGSGVTVSVTVYNNTAASFYYNKTETVSNTNSSISYTVSGIESKDEVPAYSFRTFEVTFTYSGSGTGATVADLHFNFVVDKSSIGGIVAQTAVDRFADILNNVVSADSYETLITAMDNRSGFNKASAITYIGNVAGSSSTDSRVIESLFGDAFMQMDLDGDGNAEPITMMIKRENIDGNTQTGDSYTYTSWGSTNTVRGVEMTLYITSQDLNNVSNGRAVVVYAAAFTKLPGSDTWSILVPLTRGTADANNYSGYGSANSFNTDTWLSDTGKSIDELAVMAS